MNFLAHSLLARGDPDLLVGQMAGDFVRGRDLAHLAPRVAEGVRLHRGVDALSDTHPAALELRRRFHPSLRRFAGIALDVGCDRHIARDWERLGEPLAGMSLAAHAGRVDALLHERRRSLPPGLARFAPLLRRERLFERWGTSDGVAETLGRLSRRSPRFAPLIECIAEIERLDERIGTLVDTLLPTLVAYVDDRVDGPGERS